MQVLAVAFLSCFGFPALLAGEEESTTANSNTSSRYTLTPILRLAIYQGIVIPFLEEGKPP
jgi:hypothetical protein